MLDLLGLPIPGVDKILCACGALYMGQTGWSISIRQKEHQSQLRHVDKSALGEHGWVMRHFLLCDQMETLYKPDQ